jgi:hypothetical protein
METYIDHLRLAHELKQSLNELLGWSGSMTHRQFMVWQKWLRDERSKPSRTDQYLIQLTYIVDNMFREVTVPPDKYILNFDRVPVPKSNPTHAPSTVRTVPIDPTGETVICPPDPGMPNPPVEMGAITSVDSYHSNHGPDIPLSQEETTAKAFMGDADPSTIIDAQSSDEHWKRQRRIWLKYAGIATDADGNVIKKGKG